MSSHPRKASWGKLEPMANQTEDRKPSGVCEGELSERHVGFILSLWTDKIELMVWTQKMPISICWL